MRGRALSSVNLTARGSYGAENIADPLAEGSDKSLENLADPAFFLPAIRSLTKLDLSLTLIISAVFFSQIVEIRIFDCGQYGNCGA